MRLLLDTHVLLWWLSDAPELAPGHRRAISDRGNAVLASAVSVAEVSIKRSLGKLDAPGDLPQQLAAQGFRELSFTVAHAGALADLPWHHRDPFDRMLLSQATHEGLTFVTVDRRCAAYDVPVLPPD